MILTNYKKDQWLTLEFGGATGYAMVLSVNEEEDGHTMELTYLLSESDVVALRAGLKDMLKEFRSRE